LWGVGWRHDFFMLYAKPPLIVMNLAGSRIGEAPT
jgi:hypothetical protein